MTVLLTHSQGALIDLLLCAFLSWWLLGQEDVKNPLGNSSWHLLCIIITKSFFPREQQETDYILLCSG